MGNSYLNRGIICVLVGICFILAAVFTESALDGLLWGLAGGALGPGIGMIIMHFYWSSPQNIERYKEKQEQKNIEVHDELNEKLRDKSGRIAYLIGLSVICVGDLCFCCGIRHSWENGSDHRLQGYCIVPVRADGFSDCGRSGSELVSQTKVLIRKDLNYEHRQS